MTIKKRSANVVLAKQLVSKFSEAEVTGLIRKKAHELWEKKGRVQGKDVEIWLEAERVVCKGVN